MTDSRIAGFQVRSDVLTGYCLVCGVLLGDITLHLAWHDRQSDDLGSPDATS